MKQWKRDIIEKVRQKRGDQLANKVWCGFKLLKEWQKMDSRLDYEKDNHTLCNSFIWDYHPFGCIFWADIYEIIE